MKNPIEIKKLAYERLEEAEILANNGKYDGAFYLAGYSVELMLKAKVCEVLGVDDLFDENNQTYGINEVRRAVKTHDIAVLLIFSGLLVRFDFAKSANMILAKTNILLFVSSGRCLWNEHIRYKSCGSQNPEDVQQLVELLQHEEGLLQWIERN